MVKWIDVNKLSRLVTRARAHKKWVYEVWSGNGQRSNDRELEEARNMYAKQRANCNIFSLNIIGKQQIVKKMNENLIFAPWSHFLHEITLTFFTLHTTVHFFHAFILMNGTEFFIHIAKTFFQFRCYGWDVWCVFVWMHLHLHMHT